MVAMAAMVAMVAIAGIADSGDLNKLVFRRRWSLRGIRPGAAPGLIFARVGDDRFFCLGGWRDSVYIASEGAKVLKV